MLSVAAAASGGNSTTPRYLAASLRLALQHYRRLLNDYAYPTVDNRLRTEVTRQIQGLASQFGLQINHDQASMLLVETDDLTIDHDLVDIPAVKPASDWDCMIVDNGRLCLQQIAGTTANNSNGRLTNGKGKTAKVVVVGSGEHHQTIRLLSDVHKRTIVVQRGLATKNSLGGETFDVVLENCVDSFIYLLVPIPGNLLIRQCLRCTIIAPAIQGSLLIWSDKSVGDSSDPSMRIFANSFSCLALLADDLFLQLYLNCLNRPLIVNNNKNNNNSSSDDTSNSNNNNNSNCDDDINNTNNNDYCNDNNNSPAIRFGPLLTDVEGMDEWLASVRLDPVQLISQANWSNPLILSSRRNNPLLNTYIIAPEKYRPLIIPFQSMSVAEAATSLAGAKQSSLTDIVSDGRQALVNRLRQWRQLTGCCPQNIIYIDYALRRLTAPEPRWIVGLRARLEAYDTGKDENKRRLQKATETAFWLWLTGKRVSGDDHIADGLLSSRQRWREIIQLGSLEMS